MRPPSGLEGPPVAAVLLDAMGTLLHLEPPAPRLAALLADAGHPHPVERVAAALAAEIRYYRAHHDRGADPESLRALRRDCAAVLAAELGGDAPPPSRLAGLLVESLRFRLFPDAVPALDALARAGVRLAVVSNWDCSLPALLERLGVASRLEAVVVSAVVGAAKPDPAHFRHALRELAVPAARALHCGDRPEYDCEGARRAGVRAVLVDRTGALAGARCPRVPELLTLATLVLARRAHQW